MSLILNGTTGISSVNGSAAAPAVVGDDPDTGIVFGTNTLGLSTAGTQRLTIDASGDVGIGTTPSAWSGFPALQIGNSGALFSNVNGSASFVMNTYFDGTNYRYITTEAASRLSQTGGNFSFQTAPSGTTGAVTTLTTRLQIAQDGNVGIGTTVTTPGLLTLRGYTGGTVGSAVSSYTKTLVIGGAYNQSYNSGNAVLLHIADYSNDAGENVYPIYCEDEQNIRDFYIHAGTTESVDSKRVHVGGKLLVGTESLGNSDTKINVVNIGASELRMSGGLSGYTHAHIALRATSSGNAAGNNRGLGMFMYDEVATNEWYAGRMYSASDNYVIGRKANPVDVHGEASAYTNSVFRIDNAGRVFLPYQPFVSMGGASANYTNAQNNAIWGGGGYIFSNRGNHWNDTTKRFTAPVEGVYLVSIGIRYSAYTGAGTEYIYIRLTQSYTAASGSGIMLWSAGTESGGTYRSRNFTSLVYMRANDYFEPRLTLTAGTISIDGGTTAQTDTFLHIQFLG